MHSQRKINTFGKPVVSRFVVTQYLEVAIQPCMEWTPVEKKLAVDQKLLARYWQADKLSH